MICAVVRKKAAVCPDKRYISRPIKILHKVGMRLAVQRDFVFCMRRKAKSEEPAPTKMSTIPKGLVRLANAVPIEIGRAHV